MKVKRDAAKNGDSSAYRKVGPAGSHIEFISDNEPVVNMDISETGVQDE